MHTAASKPACCLPSIDTCCCWSAERAWQMPLGPRTSDGYQLYSYMVLELGGPSMYLLGTKRTYRKDPELFVKHATGMLQVCVCGQHLSSMPSLTETCTAR